MEKIIRILEAQGLDSLLVRAAPFAIKGYGKEAHGNLTQLCRGKENLMAAVLAGAIGLHATKRAFERGKESVKGGKNAPRHFGRELKKYLDAIELLYLLDNSIDLKSLMGKAVDYLSGKLKRKISHNPSKDKKDHKAMVRQIIGAVLADTGHSKNAAHEYLANFLNSIGYTTLGGKPFTRQNISK